MDLVKLKSVLESLLFISGEPIQASRLAKICNIPKNDIDAALRELGKDYEEGKRGFIVIFKEDYVQLATSPLNQEFVGQLVSGELGSELSHSALETLSIVAYRGPIPRVQIEAIRGVNCSYVLRSLLLRGLIERKEAADIRGYLYEISFDFLKKMGVGRAEELPDWEKLSKNEKVEELLRVNFQESEKDDSSIQAEA
jgi:segregation and condensation protein B